MVFKGDRIKQLTDPAFSVIRIIGQRKVLSIQVLKFKGRKYSLLCSLDFVAFTDLFIYLKISMRREKNVVSRLGMRIFPCRDFHKRNLATVNSFMAERQLCDHFNGLYYALYSLSVFLLVKSVQVIWKSVQPTDQLVICQQITD